MKTSSPFLIYDAAAGSGKTYSLVKRYISTLLEQPSNNYYKQLLALTFTNKAVAEMKERIVATLVTFADKDVLKTLPPMFVDIAGTLEIEPLILQKRASAILKHLLHNYAAFSVETIDSFNHRLIRTFAKDLKLPSNFEVILDIDNLFTEAIDSLINKAGTDKAITKVLVDFALKKTDDDRSWDISFDLFNTSKMLANEDDAIHLEGIKNKSLEDFIDLNKSLNSTYKTAADVVINKAEKILDVLELHGLTKEDFSRGSFYTHFKNLASSNFEINLEAAWILKIHDTNLYPTRLQKERPEAVAAIEELMPFFIESVESTKEKIPTLQFLDAVLKKITPLSVLNLIQKELEQIKQEQNVLPLFQFNAIINKEIKDQPAPFIYERMGERYRHFFIDEFQDTSVMQWENLQPLIDNMLTQTENAKDGSLLLVGDVKQSIYRWRGGKPEQFLNMINGQSPFASVNTQVENLPINYRSLKEVVSFNNNLFTYLSSIFYNAIHQDLYLEGNHQEAIKTEEGYVSLSFIEGSNKDEKQVEYAHKTLSTVQNLIKNGFNYSDICILTRRRADGIYLSEFLMEQEIPVISTETLLLEQSDLVQTIIGLLKVNTNPENKEALLIVLDFLYTHLDIKDEKHTFFIEFVQKEVAQLPEIIKKYNIEFSWEKLNELSVYESVEYIIEHFNFAEKADAYLYGLMDFIFEFEQKEGSDMLGFLSHWDKKREKESISSGSGIDGIQFMTIHKSKGLEFPVVIFPYADVSLYKENQATTWIPLPEDWQVPFSESLIDYSNKIAAFSEEGIAINGQRKETLQLDTINLLYVTLTRAIEQLYIFSETPSSLKSGEEIKTFPQAFKGFLEHNNQWEGEEKVYTFGKFQKKITLETEIKNPTIQPDFITIAPEKHDIKVITREAQLWETSTQDALDLGNLVHDTMEHIKSKNDVASVLESIAQQENLSGKDFFELKNKVDKIVKHPELQAYFEQKSHVENERDIITKDGYILRPDRLVFHEDNTVSIIDYKTGKPDYSHEEQINVYAQAIKEMEFTIKDKIVVYVDEEIKVNKVNLAQ